MVLEVVGDSFFLILLKILDKESVLGTLGDALRRVEAADACSRRGRQQQHAHYLGKHRRTNKGQCPAIWTVATYVHYSIFLPLL